MNLSKPPATYDANDQAQMRSTLEAEDARNLKRGVAIDKLLFRDTATGKIVTVTMTSGAFVITVPP